MQIVIVEVFRWRYIPPTKRSSTNDCSLLFGKIFQLVGIFLFGAACSQMATDFGKFTVGRLRYYNLTFLYRVNIKNFNFSPHFYDVCQPKSLNGTELCPLNGPPTYITNYQCTGSTDKKKLTDAR